MSLNTEGLLSGVLDGDHRSLARTITAIENRTPGYRGLVSKLHEHTGDADVVGITGSPGSGKSTLVDKLALEYRDRGHTVGVIAIDPSSPYTGGAVLGDRVRMASTDGDMDVFVRSMSARGSLGGLSAATTDAIRALDAFGKDKIVVETVGAGQNEIDVVRAADTVAVLVVPGAGDDVQMLKAGILEIADVFVVNKADLDGADRTVQQLRELLRLGDDVSAVAPSDVHTASGDRTPSSENGWTPAIVETVATRGEGVDELLDTFDEHRRFLAESGQFEANVRRRYAEEIRTLVREDLGDLLEAEFERRGGVDGLADAVARRETDPYTVADEIVAPLAEHLGERKQ